MYKAREEEKKSILQHLFDLAKGFTHAHTRRDRHTYAQHTAILNSSSARSQDISHSLLSLSSHEFLRNIEKQQHERLNLNFIYISFLFFFPFRAAHIKFSSEFLSFHSFHMDRRRCGVCERYNIFSVFHFAIYSRCLLPTLKISRSHPTNTHHGRPQVCLLVYVLLGHMDVCDITTTSKSKPHIISLEWEFCLVASDFNSCRFFVLTIQLLG